MPLIEYRCKQCAQVFERLVPSTAGAERGECPTCGQLTGQRLLSVFAQPRSTSVTAEAPATCCGGACCAAH